MEFPHFKKTEASVPVPPQLSIEACLFTGRIEGTGFQSDYLLEVRMAHPQGGPVTIRKVTCVNAEGTPFPRMEKDFSDVESRPRFDGPGKSIVLNLPVPTTYLAHLKENPAFVQVTTSSGEMVRAEVNRAVLVRTA